jgi:putative protein kinase ArgK-like GTPase of G3E family
MRSRAEGANAMTFQIATLQPAAKKSSDAEVPDLHTDALSSAETDVEIAPLVLKVGASSIAGLEKLLSELQEARNFLQSEGERVQRETAQYINLARTASASVKIISDSVREWREAGHPLVNRSESGASEIAVCAEN